MGKGFAPKVSLLVEVFIGMTGVQVVKDCAVSCWNDPREDVPHQRDKGAHANIISYLDELATCQPLLKAWDELIWPPPSAVPHLPCQNEHVGYIQRHVVELGLTMPPSWFRMSDPGREFICLARGLIFEGNALACDPITNGVEWIPVHGTANDLSQAEEISALVLCNMVPHIPDKGAERLDRFGECMDENERDGVKEASSAEAPHEEEVEEQTMDEDDREEEDEDMDDEDVDDEDRDEDSESHSSSGSIQESPHSTHCYSDRCCHHPCSQAKQSESGNGENGSFGKLSVSENSEGEGGGEAGCLQVG